MTDIKITIELREGDLDLILDVLEYANNYRKGDFDDMDRFDSRDKKRIEIIQHYLQMSK